MAHKTVAKSAENFHCFFSNALKNKEINAFLLRQWAHDCKSEAGHLYISAILRIFALGAVLIVTGANPKNNLRKKLTRPRALLGSWSRLHNGRLSRRRLAVKALSEGSVKEHERALISELCKLLWARNERAASSISFADSETSQCSEFFFLVLAAAGRL